MSVKTQYTGLHFVWFCKLTIVDWGLVSHSFS